MLITPEEVIAYSVFEAVKSRPEDLLQHDILEAETEIQSIVGHDFSGEKYQPLPEKVKLALLKLAQYFALINSDESIVKGYKSEKNRRLFLYAWRWSDHSKARCHKSIKRFC